MLRTWNFFQLFTQNLNDMAKFIQYEGISFNADWVKTKSFEEFFDHEKHHGLSEEKMREIYDAIVGNTEGPAPEEQA